MNFVKKEGKMMKKRNEHIVHALAVYCCLEAIRNQQFIADIDLTPMRTLLRDTSCHQEQVLKKALEILDDMKRW